MKDNTKTYTATGILLLVIVLWMASGLIASDSDATDAKSADNNSANTAELMRVEVAEINPQIMERKLTLQGQMHANRKLFIRADTGGSIEALPLKKGSRIETGTLLARLTIEGRASELKEAQARIRTAASEQTAARKLQKQGLQSQLKADQAQAALESARASLERIELEIGQTEIRAPFSGVINHVPVELGQQIEKGTIIAELVDDSSFRVTAHVAQQSVHQLTLGQTLSVRLITGNELTGKLTFISAVANASTRSFEIEAEIENKGQQIAAGISASVFIPVEKLEAFFISPSTMALSDNGDIGVKAVNSDNKVEFYPVTLVQTDSTGAWVTGVPAGTRLITLGQGFVNEGQQVEPVMAEPPASPESSVQSSLNISFPHAGSILTHPLATPRSSS